jgi:hypothetical protein
MAACGPVKGPVRPILTTCSPAVAPTDIVLKATAVSQPAPAYGFFIALSSYGDAPDCAVTGGGERAALWHRKTSLRGPAVRFPIAFD